MSDMKWRRWLYIDPSRSKKRDRAKVKTSASFSHIYTIAETSTKDKLNENGAARSGSNECNGGGEKLAANGGHKMMKINHSSSFGSKGELSRKTTAVINFHHLMSSIGSQ